MSIGLAGSKRAWSGVARSKPASLAVSSWPLWLFYIEQGWDWKQTSGSLLCMALSAPSLSSASFWVSSGM